MPFLANLKKNEEENISGESGIINPGQQNIAAPKPVKNSGSWTNLNAYLDANKGNAEQMGATIAGKINDQGSKTQGLIDNSRNDFTTKADAGTISNLAGAQKDAEDITKAARYNADNVQVNDEQINRFKEVSNAAYKGPADLSFSDYYSDAQKNLNKSNEYKSNAQNDEGRFNLLQEFFNRPTYSQGQKAFDNLLIQGNQDAKNNIQNSANSLNNLQGNWDAANLFATDLANQRTLDSNAANAAARSYLTSNRNERTDEVDADLKGISDNWNNEYNTYSDLLTGYNGGDFNVTQEQADKLGLTNGSGQGIYNLLAGNDTEDKKLLDLKAYDASKVVSKDQFAQLAALDMLANQFGGNSISKFSNKDDAGTLGLNNNFNASRFGDAANTADTNFNQYAADANVSAAGQGKRDYYTGLFGTEKHSAGAETSIDANLANYLSSGAYNVDGTAYNNATGGLIYKGDSSSTGNFAGDAINDLGEAIFSDDWSGNNQSGDAASGAKADANYNAQQNFMAALNQILDSQGYSNRVRIK